MSTESILFAILLAMLFLALCIWALALRGKKKPKKKQPQKSCTSCNRSFPTGELERVEAGGILKSDMVGNHHVLYYCQECRLHGRRYAIKQGQSR